MHGKTESTHRLAYTRYATVHTAGGTSYRLGDHACCTGRYTTATFAPGWRTEVCTPKAGLSATARTRLSDRTKVRYTVSGTHTRGYAPRPYHLVWQVQVDPHLTVDNIGPTDRTALSCCTEIPYRAGRGLAPLRHAARVPTNTDGSPATCRAVTCIRFGPYTTTCGTYASPALRSGCTLASILCTG